MPLSEEEVRAGYRTVLGREPESDAIVTLQAGQHDSLIGFVRVLLASEEFASRRLAVHGGEYRAAFSAPKLIERFRRADRESRPGFITDYVGSLTDTSYFSDLRTDRVVVEEAISPGNFHADEAEWIAVLRAVDLARDAFCVVELGAGWAPWTASSALAARYGKGVRRVTGLAVEMDRTHAEFARRHLAGNGLAEPDFSVVEAAVGVASGQAFMPVPDADQSDWGRQAVPSPAGGDAHAPPGSDYRGRAFERWAEVPMLSLAGILERAGGRVDLLHVDIQGSEVEVIGSALLALAAQVRFMVIGTHSRQIDLALFGLLRDAGWRLEVEKPSTFSLGNPSYPLIADGTQGWRNLAFPERAGPAQSPAPSVAISARS